MPGESWSMNVVMPALLRHARTTYGTAMRQALAESGFDDIPRNGLYVVGALAIGEVPLAQVIRELRVSKQSAGQLVDTLVLRGYLDRTVNEADRRSLNVALTVRGRAAADVQAAARARIDAELLARVGPDKVAATRETLAALIDMHHGREGAEEGV
jgi:DNA-binding MarR family transcriptional regulator